MARAYPDSVIDSLGQLFSSGTLTAASEAQLLERFLAHADSSAFEAILERHGPMVLRVCQRVLDDPDDVDDAFQATFLILVKKAASIRDRTILAAWLHGVARRVAVRVRVNARQRRSREVLTEGGSQVRRDEPDSLEANELRAVLDEELERLPSQFRKPLILCDLEGQTHEQAARLLRCPVGTVKSRLSRGRERLRTRLVRRGIAPVIVGTAFLRGQRASALSQELVQRTLRTALALSCGKAGVAGAASAQVATVVQDVTRSMSVARLSVMMAMSVAAVFAGAAVVTFGRIDALRPLVFQATSRDAKSPVPPSQKLAIRGTPVAADGPIRRVKNAEPGSERFVLGNGLTVILRPIKGARSIALAVLYDIGEDHDPPGKSGLAHLLEHVYLTSAAGKIRPRSYAEFQAKYGDGFNAQTGDGYTIFATVFPRNDLERELEDAAARMGDLHIDPDDLEYERSRVLVEVGNMFGAIPSLAAINLGREMIRPNRQAGRRGGLPAHVKTIALSDLEAHWKRYYKPANAILSLAGAIDPGAVRNLIAAPFAKLPSGERVPPPPLGTVREPAARNPYTIKMRRSSPESQSTACLVYAAPPPGDALYAPFLLLVSRLSANATTLGDFGSMGSPVYFTPLDDGAIVAVMTKPTPGEDGPQAIKRLEAFVRETIKPDLRLFELMTARQQLGPLLGLVETSDIMLARNPYRVAFSLARRDQLNLVSAELGRAWESITSGQIRRAADQVFSPERRTALFVAVED